ncbi:ATP-binding cassette domain-containing protein [Nocardiopsis halophila]|uniref:hypothetical protein n=1 Tax=Nocardiopsis halophila TaxID=141692 RepID=UPI000379244A
MRTITPALNLWAPAGTRHRAAQSGTHAAPAIADRPVAVEVGALLRRQPDLLTDLTPAARCADHLIALAGGRVHAQGPPQAVLTPEAVEAVSVLRSRIITDPVSGRSPMPPMPPMPPIGRHHGALG